MKKIISILLLVVILLSSFSTFFIFAEDSSEYTQDTIIVDCRGIYLYLDVFKSEEDLVLIPIDILSVCGGLECRTEGTEYVYSKSGSSNSDTLEREIRIKTNGSQGRSLIHIPGRGYLSGVSISFKDSYTNNGNLYLPLEELLPFLDATVEISVDGILHIYPNPVSIFEAISYGPYNDLDSVTFDVDNVIGGKFIGATGLLIDSVINLRFDRLDFVFDTGATKDYKKLFEKILVENDTYLSAFDEEETPSDKAFGVIYDFIDEGNDFIEKVDDTALGNTKKTLKYLMGSDKFKNYKEFSDDLDTFGEYAKAADFIYECADYINVLTNMVEDHQNMMFAVYGQENTTRTPASVAANEVAKLYSQDTAGVITSYSVSALRDYIAKEATKPILEKITPYAVAFDVVKLVLPDAMKVAADSANIFYLDTIVSDSSNAFNDCYDNMTFDGISLEDIRLSLIMTLVSSKYSYDLYYFNDEKEPNTSTGGGDGSLGGGDSTGGGGSRSVGDLNWKYNVINEWLEKLYLAADSVDCITPAYYSRTKSELAKDIESLEYGVSVGLEFTLNDDGQSYSVTGMGTCEDTDITIPSIYNGKLVTVIGDFAFAPVDLETGEIYSSSLRSVTIPNSVTSIGELAFAFCESLTSIEIPDSVTSIDMGAFGACSSLEAIKLSNSIDKISDALFAECSSLKEITIPDSVQSIGVQAFQNCTSLTSVVIPNSVAEILPDAFEGCTSLTSIYYTGTIAEWESVSKSTDISDRYWDSNTGDYTIHCTDGTIAKNDSASNVDASEGLEFTLNDDGQSYSVTGIGTCTDTDVVIPSEYNGKAVTSIGSSAFDECTSLASITIPNSVESIGDFAFYGCTSLTSITIGDSVTSIGGGAFSGCTSLTSVNIPDSVTSIDGAAFRDCTSLTRVAIPDSVTSITSHMFYGCTSLTSITIPNSVTSIGDYAFYACTSLTSITIGDSVTRIGYQAFVRCASLTSIVFEGAVDQWKAIRTGSIWAPYTNYTIYCTDGTVTLD